MLQSTPQWWHDSIALTAGLPNCSSISQAPMQQAPPAAAIAAVTRHAGCQVGERCRDKGALPPTGVRHFQRVILHHTVLIVAVRRQE